MNATSEHSGERQPRRKMGRQSGTLRSFGGFVLAGALLLPSAIHGAVSQKELARKRLAPLFEPPAEYTNQCGSFRPPLTFSDGRAVKSSQDWSARREEIRRAWHKIMGTWPPLIEKPQVQYLSREKRENFFQLRLQIETAPKQKLEAYLLIPEGQGPFPAVLVPFYEPET